MYEGIEKMGPVSDASRLVFSRSGWSFVLALLVGLVFIEVMAVLSPRCLIWRNVEVGRLSYLQECIQCYFSCIYLFLFVRVCLLCFELRSIS